MRANPKRTPWLAQIAVLLGFAAVAAISARAEIPLGERRSGYADLATDTKAMQDDDTANPGMLWVQDGEALWNAKSGATNRACADCHSDAHATMKGVAARYPAFDARLGRPIDLEQRINLCRAERQQAPAFAYESKELLSLSAFIAKQSRGEQIAPAANNLTTARASSTCHAASATMTTGASGWRAASSRKRSRPAIRSIGWNGNPSARCSDACAIASSACARSHMITARQSMFRWSSI